MYQIRVITLHDPAVVFASILAVSAVSQQGKDAEEFSPEAC